MNVNQLAADYERDGCIRVKNFLSPEKHQEAKAAIHNYIEKIVPKVPEGDRTFEVDEKNIRNLWRMEQHDPYFAAMAKRPEIIELVSKLVHGTPTLIAVESFNKPAKIGSGIPAHQDNAYFCQTPADVLTIWIAMDAATMENGPIYYIKGSQKLGNLPHKASGVKGNSFGLAEMPQYSKDEEFCGTLDAGSALIHHSRTIHWSAPNKSDYPRCGLLMVFRGAHTKDDPAMKAAYTAAMSKK